MKTIKLIYISIIILSISGCAFKSWDTEDKLLTGALITTHIIDCKQTQYIFNHPESHRELNPVINIGVANYGKGFIPIYFLTATISELFIADKLKPATRGRFLGFLTGASFSVVYFNNMAGIKIKF